MWDDNIEMDLKEIGWESMDEIGLLQDRDKWQVLMTTVLNFWVSSGARNLLTS
jgi:hypothetical protein